MIFSDVAPSSQYGQFAFIPTFKKQYIISFNLVIFSAKTSVEWRSILEVESDTAIRNPGLISYPVIRNPGLYLATDTRVCVCGRFY